MFYYSLVLRFYTMNQAYSMLVTQLQFFCMNSQYLHLSLLISALNIGFMVGSLTYDKDGVSALGVLYELAAYLNRQGKQLHQQLATIYEKYVDTCVFSCRR